MNSIKKEKIWSEKYVFGNVQTDAEIRNIAAELGVSEIFAVLLYNRGYKTPDEANRFLRFETDDFYDPFLLDDMESAVRRISAAVDKGEKICIYGDYAVDGVTSVSMLYLYLTELGADVTIKIPRRDCEGYGMSAPAIDVLAEAGVTLIVTVDTGITANDEILYAASLGIDVVVTDHHECRPELPEACAVVNPHRHGSKYPFCDLAGVGVVFKLVCAYEMTLCRTRGEAVIEGVGRICKKYSDLAAIGTIADVMPLVDENRLIVSMGLKLLENTERAGLAALIEASSPSSRDSKSAPRKRKISAGFIGFGTAPRINAAGRISDSIIAVNLLLEKDKKKAEKYAAELCEINRQRQIEENKIAEEAYDMIENYPEIRNSSVIVLENDNWQQGIIGIVSSRITERYGLPSILISFRGAFEGEASDGDNGKGSGRSIKGMNLVEALDFCGDTLEKYGGHELAAGLTVKRGRVDEFRKKINEYAKEKLCDELFKIKIDADCELDMSRVTLSLAEEIQRLEPFGVGTPTPLFSMRDVTVQRVMQLGGGKHTKLILEKDGISVCGMYFGISASELGFESGDKIDLLFNLDINDYKNLRSVQMLIQDARLSERYVKVISDSKKRYEEICAGDGYSEEENVIPTRDDFAAVYTVLRHEFRAGTNVLDDKTLIKLVNSYDRPQINYIKLKYILRIMNELRICGVEEIDKDIFKFEIFFNATKTSIDKSSILKKLKSKCYDRAR
ncbi:MAG: single-stranded-DNA-specific exonuclease RecJ [Clostridia bacterium]|nr:single-stranded-DNA-specific exonuclease RecJ [Clostridia bacterium]